MAVREGSLLLLSLKMEMPPLRREGRKNAMILDCLFLFLPSIIDTVSSSHPFTLIYIKLFGLFHHLIVFSRRN